MLRHAAGEGVAAKCSSVITRYDVFADAGAGDDGGADRKTVAERFGGCEDVGVCGSSRCRRRRGGAGGAGWGKGRVSVSPERACAG